MAASPDEIVSLVCFARVVAARSFTAAADALGLSKSVVSARVSQLEDQLGVRLLHRTTRKLSLTPEGEALFASCTRLLAAADEAAAAVVNTAHTPRGILRVNAPVVFTQEFLAEPMAAYLARHPDVRIELTMSDRFIDLVEEGIDVAVRITSRLQDAGLTVRKLATDRTVVCASPDYLARRGTPQTPYDLLTHDCLIYTLVKISDEWRFRDPDTGGIVSPPIRGRFSAASGSVVHRAALAGMGIAVLPTFMVAADVAAGRLVPIVDSFHGTELGVYAAYPQTRRPPSKVRAFVDLLVAHFETPRWPATPRARRPEGARVAVKAARETARRAGR